MTDKITLTNLVNLQNETTAVNAINANNAAITTALDNTLSRDGTTPNTMGASLDMNSNRIINLPTPVSVTEPVTLAYMNNYLTTGQGVTGLTGVPVSAAMQPVVNASSITSAQTLLGITIASNGSVINVKNSPYNAVGDGITDDTAAIQSAITAAQSFGNPLYLPAGNYKITSSLNVTTPLQIYGAGPYLSVLQPISSINGISVLLSSPGSAGKWQGPTFESFGIAYPTQASVNKAAITVTATTFEVNQSTYRNLWINQAGSGIHFVNASYFVVDDCNIMDSALAGIFVEDQNFPDSGTGTITNTTIFNPFVVGNTYGILWQSGGGLRVTNSKINEVRNGITVQLSNGVATGDIMINNNSLEAYSLSGVGSAISIFRLGSTGTLHSTLIEGNQIGSFANGIVVPLDSNGVWMTNLLIIGNEIITNNTGSVLGIVVNSTNNFIISNNLLFTSITGGTGIITGSTADNGVIGPNLKAGSWGANSISSTNTTLIAPN